MSEEKKENQRQQLDDGQELRAEEGIIKGAQQTDQLEKLEPDNEEEKNTRENQAGVSPKVEINRGE